MNAEHFLFIAVLVMAVVIFAAIFHFESKETVEQDLSWFSERFDRLEVLTANSAIDLCFESGGKWVADENGLVWDDLTLFERASCVRAKARREG